jgi:hypothetical protein
MTDPIALIITLTGCQEDEARLAYDATEDTVDAVEMVMNKIAPLAGQPTNPRKRKRADITPDEEYIDSLRPTMERLNANIEANITSSQRADSLGVVTQVPHEETVPQNNYLQECQIPSVQEEAQTQETESL